MKILNFRAENIKRLKVVEITPDGNIVEITGLNGAGKTSVLDSIWWALAGASTHQDVPIRDGASKAVIRLDLGELTVTRKFRKEPRGGEVTTSLIVENAEGIPFRSPQAMLDGLVGALAFDPLEFLRSDAKKQFKILQNFVPDVDFYGIEEAQSKDYQERTLVNRQFKEAEAAAKAIQIDYKVQAEPVDIEGLLNEYEKAMAHNRLVDAALRRKEDNNEEIESLKTRIAKGETQLAQWRKNLALLEVVLTEPIPDVKDTAQIRTRIEEARVINEAIGLRRERVKWMTLAESLKEKSEALTEAMRLRQEEKEKAIAAAKMPIPGLGFGPGFVVLNGVPFNQASDAEQLRAAIAIAMAGDPMLKIVRVRDGSLLDPKSMRILAEMAQERDFQIWIETVGEGGDRPAIVIEDGQVRAEAAPKRAPGPPPDADMPY